MDIFENQKKVRLCNNRYSYIGYNGDNDYLTANSTDSDVQFVDNNRGDENNSWWDIHPVSPGNPDQGYKLSNQGYY
ncbi:MAG: hypothetical protein V4651_12705, partial [Bacteroidota bacterium]